MTTATARRDEIATDFSQTKERLAAARAALGKAVAENRDAARLRREVFDLQARAAELEAAVPAAEAMVAEEAEATRKAEAERLRVEEAEHQGKRVEVARRVDAALAALGTELAAFLALPPRLHGGFDHAGGARLRQAYRAAVLHGAPALFDVLKVERLVLGTEPRLPLAESVARETNLEKIR